jgi:hypothetical protein
MKVTPTIVGVLLAALALAGCASSAPDTPAGGDGTPAAENPSGTGGVCEILASDDIESALGGAFEEGAPRTGEASVDGVEWTTTGCGWEGDAMDVTATIAPADAFPAGFECVEPGISSGDVTSLDDLGALAWWTWDDFQGGTGTVIVCTDDTRIDVEVEGPRDGQPIDEAATRLGATTLATRLLSSLG